MDLNYQRCPEDDAKVLTATLGVSRGGQTVELGIAELATSVQMKGSAYATTLAIKSGVTYDFVSRVASSLSAQMGEDVHALCPVLGILVEAMALMTGGYSTLDDNGLVNVYPDKDCAPWMKEYFKQLAEEK